MQVWYDFEIYNILTLFFLSGMNRVDNSYHNLYNV